MSTNFKTFLKILVLFLCTFSLAESFEIKETLNKSVKKLYPIDLKARSFILGNYKATTQFKDIELLDKDKKFLRKISLDNKLQSNFYFVAEYTGKYFFRIENGNKKNSLNLKINKIFQHQKNIIQEQKIISPFLKKFVKQLDKTKDTKPFWEKIKKRGTPLVEKYTNNKYILTFLYKGANFNVILLGGPTTEHIQFYRLKNSDIWYRSFIVKEGISMSYQITADVPTINASKFEKKMAMVANAQKDPFNKTPFIYAKQKKLSKYETLSTFTINNKNFKDWGKEKGNQKGTITTYNIHSNILQNNRKISIYKPYMFNYKKEHDLLFVFDGKNYQNKINTPLILDNLIAEKKIKPTIAVFINNPSRESRSKELPPNSNFAKFMAKELLPFIKEKIKFNHKASNTILTGSSYGGIASTYVALSYPKLFGKVLSQSGSFWWSPKYDNEAEWLTREFAKNKKQDIKFYLNAGTYETNFLPLDILETNRHFRTVLISKGYDVTYEEFIGGHDYFAWKIYLANGLMALSDK